MLNSELLKMARRKVAFQPPMSMMDPAMMGGGAPPGAPPMDPSMGGGAPPGAPPMDPAMMGGGAPPMDPAAGGGPVPGGGGMTSDTIRQIIQQELANAGAGAGAGAGGAGAGKPAKPDLNMIAIDVFQLKTMITHMFKQMGLEIPEAAMHGPSRDPSTGAQLPPGTPGSTSDPAVISQSSAPPGGAGPGSAIPPMGAMQGAGVAAGGQEKQSDVAAVMRKAAAMSAVLRKRREKSM